MPYIHRSARHKEVVCIEIKPLILHIQLKIHTLTF
jgi:hypothetical protein